MSKRHSESTIKSDTATKQIKYSSQQTQANQDGNAGDLLEDRPFAENVQHCTIKIAPDAASQRKKQKKRSKREGIDNNDEESSKDRILKQSCALLNSGGGLLVIKIADYQSPSTTEAIGSSKNALLCLDEFWKTIEPKLKVMVKPFTYDQVFDRCVMSDEIHLFISVPEHFKICTLENNLFFPGDASSDEGSYEQVLKLLQKKSLGRRKKKLSNVVDISLKELPKVPKAFTYKQVLSFHESKQMQLKHLESETVLQNHAQRERICKHISAFANAKGGVILLGVRDSGEVIGLNIENNPKDEIEETVTSMISNMLFPVTPERKVHWDMEFIPVSGCEDNAVLVIKVAGMEGAGGVFAKCPKSFELQEDKTEPRRIEFDQWKKRMLSGVDVQTNSKAMEDLCSKFTKLRMSNGHLLTVKDDVQKIRDSFFTVQEGFPVTPKGFETNLSKEVQAVIRRIRQDCSKDGNRGLLAASHSWRANLGGKPMDGVICDFLLISRNMGGLHLITVCQDESEGYLQYSKEVAQNIKRSLVQEGGCMAKFYVSYHVVSRCDEVVLALPDDRYPQAYDLKIDRKKLNQVLQALVIILAKFPSMLSNKMGVDFFNLLTKEQFMLLHQQIEVNRKLWIKGVAGTGKTVVAIEFMRVLHRRENLFNKDEILCVCENEGITQQIRETNLCDAVCRQTFMRCSFPKARHVVMDEVHNYEQPNPRESWYQKAQQIVRQHDPDNPGYLWFFTDKYQRDHSYPTGMPPEHQQKPDFTLKTVIRNSEKIFKHAKKYLGLTDLVLGHDFKGEDVKVIHYSKSKKSQAEVLNTTFSQLFKEGYVASDIAVLLAKKGCIPDRLISELNGLTCTARENSSNKVVVSSVNKFSGLERPVVVLVDLECSLPHGRKQDPFLFSAVTRAMVKLIIIRCQTCRNK